MIDLNGMMLFVRVVQAGGFSAAARALDIPKSTISRQIAALELRLGSALLRRNTRGLSLTAVGESYYRRALSAVAEAEAAEAEALELARAPRGLLRITATVGFGQTVLHGILCEYLGAYPDVRLDVHLSDERVNLVRDGFDLAIRMGALDDSELIARRLGRFARVVCASPAYLQRRGRPETPADLAGHDCLIIDRRLAGWQFGAEDGAPADGELHEVRVPWRLCADNVEVVRTAVRGGHGIANLPRYLVEGDLASGTLVELLARYRQPPVDISAVYPATREPAPPLRALIDLLIDRLRSPAAAGSSPKPPGTGPGA